MIRQYTPNDLPDLLETWEAASAVAHPFLSEEFLAAERENIPNLYLPNAETWVWEESGVVVGFIALIGNEVGAIFVHPNSQRNGIGAALLAKAGQLRGDLEVEVFAANAIGRSFYAKSGFVKICESIHEQTGNPLIRLRLTANSNCI